MGGKHVNNIYVIPNLYVPIYHSKYIFIIICVGNIHIIQIYHNIHITVFDRLTLEFILEIVQKTSIFCIIY